MQRINPFTFLFHYLNLGYPLLPLKPGDKKPLTRLVPHGLKEASAEPSTVEQWFRTAPSANWGLLPPAEVLVLDIDQPKAIEKLLADYPRLATAPRQRTPRGGAHVFLRLPAEVPSRLSASTRTLAGCDLRGLGRAYVAVAPSAVKGQHYHWEVGLLPPGELPEIPAGLLDQLLPSPAPAVQQRAGRSSTAARGNTGTAKRLAGLLRWACEEVAAAPQGSRHNTLLSQARLVGGWLHHGLDELEAEGALVQAGMAAGLPEGEARAAAKAGLQDGKRNPLELPPDKPRAQGTRRLRQGRGEAEPSAKQQAQPACSAGPHPLEGLEGGGKVLGLPRYQVQDGRIQAARVEGRGENRSVDYWLLANFAAVIRREVRATDGVETETLFELEGYLYHGQALPRAQVSASEFAGMNWVNREWGSSAVVTAGGSAKDHLRAAILFLSEGQVEQATVYRHLGWARLEEGWCYLHAGGAIAAKAPGRVEVQPGRVLEGFTLPEPPGTDTEPECIRLLWELLEVAPRQVSAPLLLYALAAPLGHAPYSLYLAGPTGARKTSLALVVQSLFGYCEPAPPVGWEATVNSLEGAAFAAKDCLLLVDDYAPTGNERTQKELQAKAARFLRSQGNAVGRLRMRADGSLVGDRPPRGSLLITGEDLPPGHSVRARTLFLELSPGDVDLTRLSQAQAQARERVYASAMAAWIRYLASDLEQYRNRLRVLTEELRQRWGAGHGRTNDALARLHAAWLLYSEYAALRGVDLTTLEAEVLGGLEGIQETQASYQRDSDPVQRFLGLLFTALRMGRAHLVPLEGKPTEPVSNHLTNPSAWGWQYRENSSSSEYAKPGVWLPQGPRIGWLPRNWEDRGLFLDPSAAWTAINRLASEQGEPLPTERTLWKRLGERKLIATEGEGGKTRYQVRVRIGGGMRVRAVHILGPYIPQSGPSGPTPPNLRV